MGLSLEPMALGKDHIYAGEQVQCQAWTGKGNNETVLPEHMQAGLWSRNQEASTPHGNTCLAPASTSSTDGNISAIGMAQVLGAPGTHVRDLNAISGSKLQPYPAAAGTREKKPANENSFSASGQFS